ncbi:MAG TPA: STAS domain-containing protein [Acidimicrobiales bacterium]|nr:STAS domain-containing protein [Acidimicrobiales bacterium]
MFVVDVDQRDGWWIVAASGEVDVATAPALRATLIDVVPAGGRRVVLDLTRVDFIDSFGLGVLVGALKRLRTHGGDLRVAASEGSVRRALELTGLDRIFDLAASVDEAIAERPVPVDE